jgi:hypothetical protein
VLPVIEGPSSEMLQGGRRVEGGRGILAMVEVEPGPTRVRAPRAAAFELDGRLDEAVWQRPGDELGTATEGEPLTRRDLQRIMRVDRPTRVWFAWDEEYLYVAGELPDADLYAPQREQDAHLWERENFEVFVSGTNEGTRYLELQVSARNVTFDAWFPSYRDGDFDWDSKWQTAVHRRGKLGRKGGPDEGWSVEAAIPWTEICERTDVRCPPEAGDRMHVNVFRLEKPDRRRQVGLGLSPTFGDFHDWSNSAILELAP